MSVSLEAMIDAGRAAITTDRSALYVCFGMLVLAALMIGLSAASGIGSLDATGIVFGP